jgi:LEA14-like dessication related protein
MRLAGCLSLVLLVVLLGGGIFAYRWYKATDGNPLAAFKEPKVDLYGFFIKSVNFQRTVADVQILVENNSPVGLDADSLHYEVYIEGTEVTRGSYNRPIHLKASDTTLITLPVTLDNQRLLRILRGLEGQRDSADYTFKAKVFADLPLLKGKPLQIQFTRKMPVYIIPELKMLEEQLRKFSYRAKEAEGRAQRAEGMALRTDREDMGA